MSQQLIDLEHVLDFESEILDWGNRPVFDSLESSEKNLKLELLQLLTTFFAKCKRVAEEAPNALDTSSEKTTKLTYKEECEAVADLLGVEFQHGLGRTELYAGNFVDQHFLHLIPGLYAKGIHTIILMRGSSLVIVLDYPLVSLQPN